MIDPNSAPDPLWLLAKLRAVSTWLKHTPAAWPALGWGDVHATNMRLYMDSARHAAGFRPFPGATNPPEFDGFHRSRQFRIKAKVRDAVAAWEQAGSPEWERAYDYEFNHAHGAAIEAETRRKNADLIRFLNSV